MLKTGKYGTPSGHNGTTVATTDLHITLDDRQRVLLEVLGEAFAKAWSTFALSFVETIGQDVEHFDDGSSIKGTTHRVEVTEDIAMREIVKCRLKSLGVTQAEIAKRMGVSAPAVNRALANVSRAKLSTIERLAKAAGVSLVSLLSIEDKNASG